MSDRILVKAVKSHLRGQPLSVGGTTYIVNPKTMMLHETMGSGFAYPEPGVLPAHIDEFIGQASFETEKMIAPPPPPPPPPGKKAKAATGGPAGKREPDPTASPPPPAASSPVDEQDPHGRMIAMGREFMEKKAASLAIPADELSDDDLAEAILLAAGYSAEDAAGVTILDEPPPARDRRAELRDMTVKDLKVLARELKVKGRSTMNEAELIDAIIEAEA